MEGGRRRRWCEARLRQAAGAGGWCWAQRWERRKCWRLPCSISAVQQWWVASMLSEVQSCPVAAGSQPPCGGSGRWRAALYRCRRFTTAGNELTNHAGQLTKGSARWKAVSERRCWSCDGKRCERCASCGAAGPSALQHSCKVCCSTAKPRRCSLVSQNQHETCNMKKKFRLLVPGTATAAADPPCGASSRC